MALHAPKIFGLIIREGLNGDVRAVSLAKADGAFLIQVSVRTGIGHLPAVTRITKSICYTHKAVGVSPRRVIIQLLH